MIFKRKQHKLPKFPPSIIPTFKSLCEALPAEKVASYRDEVGTELERVKEAAQENPIISVRIAEALAERCYLLLDHYEQLGTAQRALAVGAIRYFALSKDAVSEEHFASGFDDDVKVLNHVLEELGIEDQFIELQ